MAIPADFLDELKARVDLVAVVSRRVALTRKGREHTGLCPFHQEKTPSFTLNEQKGFYHCFGCGAHGSVIDFVMQADRLEFRDAVGALAASIGLAVPDDRPEREDRRPQDDQRGRLCALNEAAARHFEAALRGPGGKAALAYVRARDLDDKLLARFRLGYAADGGGGGLRAALGREGFSDESMIAAGLLVRAEDGARPPYARFRNRVMFPIADARGRIVGFGGRSLGDAQPKYLNTAETEIFHKGRLLYGFALACDAARRRGSIVVVEGYMDVIGLARAGIDHAVAPLGTALTEDQLRLLWRLVPEPILCFDPDRAGRRAAMRAAERALPLIRAGTGLRFAFLGTDTGDDPDGVARRYPRQFLDRAFAEAVPLSDVIFWMETGGATAVAAEDRAAVEVRLRRRLENVGDGDVRAHFMRAFRERLWQRTRRAAGSSGPSRTQPAWRAGVEPPPVADAGRRIRPRSAVATAERTLMACLLNHPHFFAQGEEDLGSLAFSDPRMERLRQGLIEVLATQPDLSRDDLPTALRARDLGEAIAEVGDDPLLARHRAIGPEASAEDLDAVWRANVAVVRAAGEGADEAGDGAGALSDDAMRRRRLLKLAALEAGDDDVT